MSTPDTDRLMDERTTEPTDVWSETTTAIAHLMAHHAHRRNIDSGFLARNLLVPDQTAPDAWVYAQGAWHGLPENDYYPRGIGCPRWLPPAPEWAPDRRAGAR